MAQRPRLGQRHLRLGRGRPGGRQGAAGRGTAVLAGQGGQIAAPGHLDEHGAALQPVTQGPPGDARQPGLPGRLVLGQLGVLAGRVHARGQAPDRRTGGHDRPGPAAGHELGGLGGTGVAADQHPRTRPVGTQPEHLAGVRVGGQALGVQVVSVVPDGDQAEPGDGGEHGGPGADDGAHLASQDLQPPPVPFRRTQVGRQRHVPARAEQAGELGVGQRHVLAVWDYDDRSPAAVERGPHGLGHGTRPALGAGQRRPDGSGRAAVTQRVEERGPGRVRVPGTRPGPHRRVRDGRRLGDRRFRRRRGLRPAGRSRLLGGRLGGLDRLVSLSGDLHRGPSLLEGLSGALFGGPSLGRLSCGLLGGFSGGLLGGLSLLGSLSGCLLGGLRLLGEFLGGLRLGLGVAGWDGQAEDVGQGARVPVGDRPGQPGDLGGEHPLGRHHPFQRGELALVIARRHSFQQEPVHELAREPHPHAHARLGRLMQ